MEYRKLLCVSPGQRTQWLAEGEFTPVARDILERLARAEDFDFDDVPERITELLAPPAALPGEQFGTWGVIHSIGQGGLGEVFLVKRDARGTEQIAAMKLLSTLSISSTEEELFRRENQYLARLGRLIDSGKREDGIEFIVMGFASEGSITSYCDQRQLNVRRRLQLFCELCEEVEHLHNTGIIHCDIKPGNVLIAADGNVHLVDFSIARLAENDRRPAPRSYTPGFAAPEQRLSTPTFSERTDIFALGKLLEQLLVGQLSQPGTTPRQPLRAQLKAHPVEAKELSRQRNTSVKTLSADFHDGIDRILMRAQQKDSNLRYKRACELYRAVLRYASSLPNPDLTPTEFWRRVWRTQSWRIAALLIVVFTSGAMLGWLARS